MNCLGEGVWPNQILGFTHSQQLQVFRCGLGHNQQFFAFYTPGPKDHLRENRILAIQNPSKASPLSQLSMSNLGAGEIIPVASLAETI